MGVLYMDTFHSDLGSARVQRGDAGLRQIRILIRVCAGVWWSEAVTGF